MFTKVKFRNFQSFGQIWTEISLNQRGTTLIVGENLDRGGSSGAGKTTAISAVSYCLYDKIPSGISKDKMINRTNDKKNTSMEVQLFFKKSGQEYMIHRKRGAETGVQLFHNGKDVTPASVGNVNSAIEELVGFSYNLFSHIVLFNGNSKAFLDLSVGDQRSLIEELFKITMLSRKAAALKKQAAETSKSIDLMKALIKQQESQNEGFWRRVKEAEDRSSRWVINHELEIARLEETITAIENIDFDTEEQLHQRISELNALSADLESQVREITVKKSGKEREKSPLQAEYASEIRRQEVIDRDLEKIIKELDHLKKDKCPYCLQSFADANKKIGELEVVQQALSEELSKKVHSNAEIKKQIDEFDKAVSVDIDKMVVEINDIKLQISSTKEEITELQSVLSYKNLKDHVTAQNAVSSMKDKLLKLRQETNPHLDAIDALTKEGEISIDRKGLDDLVNLQAHQAFLIKLLTDKNSYVRKNLISTTTPYLNKRIGYYVEKLNLPHIVLFQPDMTCEISEIGRPLDHGNLSNGEKKKLNLALCLSFRDVLTYLHSKVNVLFTDEVDGGSISGNDVDCLISLLKHKSWDDNLGIYIISHRPEFEGRCDRNIVIRKEQGFSSLIIQPEG